MPSVNVDQMWTRAGAHVKVVVQCPHAVHTASTVTKIPVGYRVAADLTNLGLPVQCDSIQAAILAEFRFFAERQRRRDSGKPPSERREITGQIFVEKLGYTVSRGILRSVFSERNPQLFCEFMRMGPSTDPENYDTILHEPFTSTKNGVFPANMITNAQVKAILKDHRRELSAKMTVGQQYSLLHTQQKMQREEAETRRKMKADAERQKLITERGIPTPSPHTAAFQTPVAQPQTALPTTGRYRGGTKQKIDLHSETPLVSLGGGNSVVVPLGLPVGAPASAPASVAAMSVVVSAPAATNLVLAGGMTSKSKATRLKKTAAKTAKKTAIRLQARKKTKTAPAVVNKTTPALPRPRLMMLEGDDVPPPPKLVRQTNGVALETIGDAPTRAPPNAPAAATAKKRRSRATRKKKEGTKKRKTAKSKA